MNLECQRQKELPWPRLVTPLESTGPLTQDSYHDESRPSGIPSESRDGSLNSRYEMVGQEMRVRGISDWLMANADGVLTQLVFVS